MLFSSPLVPPAGVVGRPLVSDVVRGTFVAQRISGVIPHLTVRGLFAFEHECRETSRIGLKGKIDEVVHAPDVLFGLLMGDLKVQAFGSREPHVRKLGSR